jgi:hypothetical protein
MEQATTIGLDIAKHVFQVYGADARDAAAPAGGSGSPSRQAGPMPGPPAIGVLN